MTRNNELILDGLISYYFCFSSHYENSAHFSPSAHKMSQSELKYHHSFFGKSRENRDLKSAAKNMKCSATRVAVVVLLGRLDCSGCISLLQVSLFFEFVFHVALSRLKLIVINVSTEEPSSSHVLWSGRRRHPRTLCAG